MYRDTERPPSALLERRLAGGAPLSEPELAAVRLLADRPSRAVAAKRELIREGDVPRGPFLVAEGWACRFKMLDDGRRQIVGLLLPGDLCDVNVQLQGRMDHSIGALTAVRVVEIDPERVAAVADDHPRLAVAFWRRLLVDAATQREWTLSNGQRSALERIAHLFCECFHRLRAVGLAGPSSYAFPLTQTDVAEATGLTPVHVNRTLQEMRATGLIVLKERMLDIPDPDLLADRAQFTPDYLGIARAAESERSGSAPSPALAI